MLLVLIALIYILERTIEPALGDALSFTVAAMDGFDWASNATNHILYINFLHLLTLVFPCAKAHFLFQTISFLGAMGTLVVLSRCLKALNVATLIRCISIVLMGLSFTFWRHAEIVEVYTLNLFITAQVVYWFIKWENNRRPKYVFLASLLLGIAMLLHVQQVLYGPFLLYWCYLAFSLKFSKWFKVAACFLLPSSLLLLPAYFGLNTYSSILFDASFQDEVMDFSSSTLMSGFIKSFGLLAFNFGAMAIAFIPAILKVSTKKSTHFGFLILAGSVYLFAARYNVSDNYVFFLPAYFVLVLLLSTYINRFRKVKLHWQVLLLFCIFSAPIGYLSLPSIAKQFAFGREMEKDKWYKGGARFFFYPGMSRNPHSIDFVKYIRAEKLDSNYNLEVEQNKAKAFKYWKLIHTSEH